MFMCGDSTYGKMLTLVVGLCLAGLVNPANPAVVGVQRQRLALFIGPK
jgi:hypothetical protein